MAINSLDGGLGRTFRVGQKPRHSLKVPMPHRGYLPDRVPLWHSLGILDQYCTPVPQRVAAPSRALPGDSHDERGGFWLPRTARPDRAIAHRGLHRRRLGHSGPLHLPDATLIASTTGIASRMPPWLEESSRRPPSSATTPATGPPSRWSRSRNGTNPGDRDWNELLLQTGPECSRARRQGHRVQFAITPEQSVSPAHAVGVFTGRWRSQSQTTLPANDRVIFRQYSSPRSRSVSFLRCCTFGLPLETTRSRKSGQLHSHRRRRYESDRPERPQPADQQILDTAAPNAADADAAVAPRIAGPGTASAPVVATTASVASAWGAWSGPSLLGVESRTRSLVQDVCNCGGAHLE